MTITSLATLVARRTRAQFYTKALEVATALELPVSSWQAGDPTRSLYHALAAILEPLELVCAEFIRSGFLDFAEGIENEWLKLIAKQNYNVDAIDATYATTTVVLTNNGGGFYPDIEAGDHTFKKSSDGKTYRNTSGGTLAIGPGSTLTLDVMADEPGSASSAHVGEIDALVTTLLDVSVTNPTATIGLDAEEALSIRDRSRLKLGALSPNGPADAYAFIARTPEFAGTYAITRVKTRPDGFGFLRVTLAGPNGPIAEADRALAEAAIVRWATPLCVTPIVASATGVPVSLICGVWLYQSVGVTTEEAEALIEAALAQMIARRPIGGDVVPGSVGKLYKSLIEATIRDVFPLHIFRVAVTLPVGDIALDVDDVLTFAGVTWAIQFVPDPT